MHHHASKTNLSKSRKARNKKGPTPHHDAFISCCIDKEYQTTEGGNRSLKDNPWKSPTYVCFET